MLELPPSEWLQKIADLLHWINLYYFLKRKWKLKWSLSRDNYTINLSALWNVDKVRISVKYILQNFKKTPFRITILWYRRRYIVSTLSVIGLLAKINLVLSGLNPIPSLVGVCYSRRKEAHKSICSMRSAAWSLSCQRSNAGATGHQQRRQTSEAYWRTVATCWSNCCLTRQATSDQYKLQPQKLSSQPVSLC